MEITKSQLDAIRGIIATFNSPHNDSEAMQDLGLKMAAVQLGEKFPTILGEYCEDFQCDPRKLDMNVEMAKI